MSEQKHHQADRAADLVAQEELHSRQVQYDPKIHGAGTMPSGTKIGTIPHQAPVVVPATILAQEEEEVPAEQEQAAPVKSAFSKKEKVQ